MPPIFPLNGNALFLRFGEAPFLDAEPLFEGSRWCVCGRNILFSRSPVLLITITAEMPIITKIWLIFAYAAARICK